MSVTMPFDASNLPQGATEQEILVYTAPQTSSDYQPLPTTVADPTHMTGQTTHFCNMFLGVPGMPGGDAGAGDGGVDGACIPSFGGVSPDGGLCSQKLTCGTHVYKTVCTVGMGSCIADGVTGMQAYGCVCGVPPSFTTTGGASCALPLSDGGFENCLTLCGYPP